MKTGKHLSSLMGAFGNLLQGDYAGIMKTQFTEAHPIKFRDWFIRCKDVIAHDNFVQLSIEIRRGVLDYLRGVCRMVCFYSNALISLIGEDFANGISQICASTYFRKGERSHVSFRFFRFFNRKKIFFQVLEILKSLIDVAGKLPASEEDGNYFRILNT